jgi:CRP/FNR family transcriptional regulator, cyclic AMP receptor protein
MVGTGRSSVSYFMTRFRKMGFIHYNGGLHVHSAFSRSCSVIERARPRDAHQAIEVRA